MTSLADKIVAISASLDAAALSHAFGGALALAWCTQRARGTIDIDVNVFVGVTRLHDVLSALPASVIATEANTTELADVGQARLWWDSTPVDLFLNTTEFHDQAALRAQRQTFNGAPIPFLGCSDLAVFKAFFNRTKDWADIEEMVGAGTLDTDRVVGVLVRYLGATDDRVSRLLALVGRPERWPQ
jgi:hypothetical protein